MRVILNEKICEKSRYLLLNFNILDYENNLEFFEKSFFVG